MSELHYCTAVELVDLIRTREVSTLEVMNAHLERISQVNPTLNAIVTLVTDTARDKAREADVAIIRGDTVGPLHGLPVAHKDLIRTKGIRTTFGSKVFQDFVPNDDALIVERLRAAGAITIGKTNTPEFGAGSQTFNDVFGATVNPYDTSKTCGGSSGGAAVALASGMVPLADGSDLGGSLRNPASFCNVVGFRPSPGRVPIWPSQASSFSMGVQGPMARTVTDAALMLSAIAGPTSRSPISLPDAGSHFKPPLTRDFHGTLIAWACNFAGLPFDPRVTTTVNAQRATFELLGCITEEAEPDMADSGAIFKCWRAWYFELCYGSLLKEHRHSLKDTVVWNIEEGQRLTGPHLGKMEIKRTALFERVRCFMKHHEFLILPVAQVPPFDISIPYITKINNVAMETYIDWMSSCAFISVLGLPAISVPCGFTDDGLPIGIQIVGRQHDDLGVLQLAHAFEQHTKFGQRRPKLDTIDLAASCQAEEKA